MQVRILKEAGYEEALLGLSLNKNQPVENMPNVLRRLAHMGGGHSKALESISVWLDVTATRFWWAEADTYRVGISKQSQSTMHTILKRELTQSDFTRPIPPIILNELNAVIRVGDLLRVKELLPEGYLQRRVIATNYKTLQNICQQRRIHKLPEWWFFVDYLEAMLQHPELVFDYKKGEKE